MKQILRFTLSFAVLSALLTWLWLSGGDRAYALWMTPISLDLHEFLGIQGRGSMQRLRFINLVPFTALVLLTPGLSRRRRFGGLALGYLVLMLSHLALNAYAVAQSSRGMLPRTAGLLSDSLPFILWFFIAREFVRSLMQQIKRTDEAQDGSTRSS